MCGDIYKRRKEKHSNAIVTAGGDFEDAADQKIGPWISPKLGSLTAGANRWTAQERGGANAVLTPFGNSTVRHGLGREFAALNVWAISELVKRLLRCTVQTGP
jgi:hypothetical protein